MVRQASRARRRARRRRPLSGSGLAAERRAAAQTWRAVLVVLRQLEMARQSTPGCSTDPVL